MPKLSEMAEAQRAEHAAAQAAVQANEQARADAVAEREARKEAALAPIGTDVNTIAALRQRVIELQQAVADLVGGSKQ